MGGCEHEAAGILLKTLATFMEFTLGGRAPVESQVLFRSAIEAFILWLALQSRANFGFAKTSLTLTMPV